jgi:hypothetical protein
VKHFSGYHVILGFDSFGGDGSSEFARVRGIPNVTGASGYITTTGFTGESGQASGARDASIDH